MQYIFTLVEIKDIAQKIYEAGLNKKVWAFHGEMGAGKTTFIHALCEFLGVTSAISSPTYSIINQYESPVAGTIYHMDWYRLKGEEEALDAGVEECLLSGKLCFVEWPERAEQLLPESTFHVTISAIDPIYRKIEF